MKRDIPCRVALDTANFYAEQNIQELGSFDIWDDDLMRECIGGRLTKPVQALLQAHDFQWEHYSNEKLKALVRDLREAVKDEWRGL